ncbi:sugar ABC transporter substrate-binding protein [Actinomyces sp.]|uniref:ABC transporter substrate-binding protein n=1 Tax=Actinomyces sp. TaxID=29317 RepID=UPI0026DAC75B|nr:sugar ABC transporter substrate-binding protein [Actinomyces sp.]
MRRREFGRLTAVAAAWAAMGVTGCSGGSGSGAGGEGEVTLEFTQWWEPELPNGSLRALMDDFESANPGIKVELLSGPYASTKEQLVAGAAARTMPDVVGLDGAWVSDFAKQGAIADLTALMTQQGYDDAELASQIQIDGATYMIPVVNFVYPMFTNKDLLGRAGIAEAPSTREEFEAAAKAIAGTGDAISGWALPLSLEAPNGIQNDVMSWVWASGGSMLTADGKPKLKGNPDVKSACEFIKGLWDAGVVSPGAFTMKEQDKVEDFTNARVGMMIDSLAHVNTIREGNPDLDFGITALPAVSGYAGERGMPYASWGIGVSGTTEHPEQARKLVEFLMSADVNASLADDAKAFPGNSTATPDYVENDELFQQAFDIWSSGRPANEFTGLPVSETLMREFDEQLQSYLSGAVDVDTMLANAQQAWDEEF